MKIGIIGIGNIGGTIARKLKAAAHEIRIANSRGPEGVQHFAEEIGVTAADVNFGVFRLAFFNFCSAIGGFGLNAR